MGVCSMTTMIEALIKARKALLEVDPLYDEIHCEEYCAWCHEMDGHTDDCQREIALEAIEEVLGPFEETDGV